MLKTIKSLELGIYPLRKRNYTFFLKNAINNKSPSLGARCLPGTNDCHVKWKQHAAFINKVPLTLRHLFYSDCGFQRRSIARRPTEGSRAALRKALDSSDN